MTISLVLFGYAAIVAVLAPRALTGDWALREPRLTLALWHAAAGSVVAAVLLAAAACVSSPGLVEACVAALVGDTGAAGVLTVVIGLLMPAALLARLTVVAVQLTRNRHTERRHHLQLLGLLGRPDTSGEFTVIPDRRPSAYCIPGTGKVVLSRGAIDQLAETEIQAILAHERAHLAGRHHLIVAWSAILSRAFPAVPIFQALHPATAGLVELVADDHATRRATRHGLAGAIAVFAGAASPETGLAASGGQVLIRVHRLLEPPRPLPAAGRLGGAGVAASLLALPGLVLIGSAALAAGLAACPLLLR
jgi:hypothetical protein